MNKDLKMFFVLNGLVNGVHDYPAVRKYSERPEEHMEDGWWIGPVEVGNVGLFHLTSAYGPYKNSKEATAAIDFLKPYADGLSVTQAVEFHLEKRRIHPDNMTKINDVLLTLLVELVEVDGYLTIETITHKLSVWDEHMSEPDAIAEYI